LAELVAAVVARRAYEYGLDRIRLSVICTERVMAAVADGFHFQVRAIATPPTTFGVPDGTSPPGAVFQNGQLGDAPLIPIRALYFEPRRIVVDIAGQSELVDRVHAHLMDILGTIQVDDQPIVGPVRARRDYSELVVRMGADLNATLSPAVRQVLGPLAGEGELLVPALYLTVQPAGSEYRGLVPGEQLYLLQQRAGTTLDSHEWFSGAPLESRDHLAYLTRLDQAVAAAERPQAG
jgi:hypothetical protein